MKDQIFGVLQRVGRSFMLPIAVLPVAGLMLGIGSSFTNATMIDTYGLQAILGEGTILNMFLTVLSKAGSALFDNLPIIFAVGCAIGMAKPECLCHNRILPDARVPEMGCLPHPPVELHAVCLAHSPVVFQF